MYQFAILLLFMKNLNFFEAEITTVLVPDAVVTPLDILTKAMEYYEKAKETLKVRREEREKAIAMEDCSDDFCPPEVIGLVPDICIGLEKEPSKCALKMLMKGKDLESFETADWEVTVIVFYKHLLDGAHSFALCYQYYYQSNNAAYFQAIEDVCKEISNYFLEMALFMTGQMINRIIRKHGRPKNENWYNYLQKDYLNMPYEEFYELFPTLNPKYKDKTIRAVKNLYEYQKYIKLLLKYKPKRCIIPDDEDRLKCVLDRMNDVKKRMLATLQNLEHYLESISCKSTLSLKPTLLNENPMPVLKTHKMVWETLKFITETLQDDSTDRFEEPIYLLIEIEKLKVKAAAKYNGKAVEENPGITEAASYVADWGDGTSKDDYIWKRKIEV